MESLVQLDRRMSLWLNQASVPELNGFWHFLSGTREWIPLYLLVMFFIFWRLGWKKGLAVVLSVLLKDVDTPTPPSTVGKKDSEK